LSARVDLLAATALRPGHPTRELGSTTFEGGGCAGLEWWSDARDEPGTSVPSGAMAITDMYTYGHAGVVVGVLLLVGAAAVFVW